MIENLDIAPNMACSNNTITAMDAFLDYRAPVNMRTGAYHCFCSQLYL